ncbi:MAG: alkaline phosphatase family protein [Prevotella sp.]|nr:alkaline phosphatase family protein [Prevotella sp.]
MRSNRYLYLTLLAVLGFHQEALAQMALQSPKLVVSIAIDQLSADEMENMAPLYGSDGLRRLLEQGRVYTNASYSFTPVDRASAIASLSTGSTPYYNGIPSLEWLDKNTLRPTLCVRDLQYGHAPSSLLTSTVGDELKSATNGVSIVYAFAPTADAAILSAGHAANGTAWISNGKWCTSAYYQPLSQWLSGHSRLNKPDADVNKSISDIAIACIDHAAIGVDDKPDLLCVTYQQQGDAMDSYISLDKNISRLVSHVEEKMGRDRVLFVLTGTGYAEERKEQERAKFRIPTGKFYINRTANLLNMYLGAVYGTAKYVETSYRNQLFLNHQLLSQKNINLGEMLRRAQEFLLQVEGVRHVYTSSQLLTSESSHLEKIRNSFSVEKCGDLLIEIAPGWQLINEDTGESVTQRTGNITFPIIFYGGNVSPERIQTPVTVDRIAPTVAKAIRIRAPNACTAEPLF